MPAVVKQSRLSIVHGRAIAAWAVVASMVLWSISSVPAVAQGYVHVGEITTNAAGDYVVTRASAGAPIVLPQVDAWRQDNPYFANAVPDDERLDLEEDLLRVQRIMQRPDQAFDELANLEVATKKLMDEQGLQPAAALEQALGAMEARHYFPDARIVALGILSPQSFVALPAKGFVLTDVGAGLDHGELAHRLQWAMIINNFENAPDEWNNTPFELFTKTGELDQALDGVLDASGRRHRNVWAHLFDQKGIDSQEVEQGFKTVNRPVVKPDGLRHPDRLTAAMVKGVDGGRPMPAAIAAGVRQRYAQRKDLFDRIRADNGWTEATMAEIEATNQAVAAALKAELLNVGYVEWNEPNLLVHKDDKAAVDREDPLTKEVRIQLSHRFLKKERVLFGSPDALARATELGKNHIDLLQNPKPLATPLPQAVTSTASFSSGNTPPKPESGNAPPKPGGPAVASGAPPKPGAGDADGPAAGSNTSGGSDGGSRTRRRTN